MGNFCPPGSRRFDELKREVRAVNRIEEVKKAICKKQTIYFPSFLLLMRRLVDIEFIGDWRPRLENLIQPGIGRAKTEGDSPEKEDRRYRRTSSAGTLRLTRSGRTLEAAASRRTTRRLQ